MRPFDRFLVASAVALAVSIPTIAEAKVRIIVDLDSQTMHVESRDRTFDWRVSTGKPGYDTPTGTYGVLWTDKDHKSDEYEQAPMPNAIFFKPGFAIHGFGRSPWGHAASHGCIRLPVAKSAILYALVKAEGAEITVTGQAPETVVAERPRRQRGPLDDQPRYDGYARYGYETPRPYDARAYDPRNDDRGYAPRAYNGNGDLRGDFPQDGGVVRDPNPFGLY